MASRKVRVRLTTLEALPPMYRQPRAAPRTSPLHIFGCHERLDPARLDASQVIEQARPVVRAVPLVELPQPGAWELRTGRT